MSFENEVDKRQLISGITKKLWKMSEEELTTLQNNLADESGYKNNKRRMIVSKDLNSAAIPDNLSKTNLPKDLKGLVLQLALKYSIPNIQHFLILIKNSLPPRYSPSTLNLWLQDFSSRRWTNEDVDVNNGSIDLWRDFMLFHSLHPQNLEPPLHIYKRTLHSLNLNEDQKSAVFASPDTSIIIDAGPGTGRSISKSTCLNHKRI